MSHDDESGSSVLLDPIRIELFAAIDSRDQQRILAICQRRQHDIVARFPTWMKIPAALRDDMSAIKAWGHALLMTAQIFASAGYDELLDRLTGKGGDNPINRWQRALVEAQQCHEAAQYERSSAIAHAVLNDMRGSRGSAIETMVPKLLGLLGSNAFAVGDLDASVAHTLAARDGCEQIGDIEGVRIYTENLAILERARGSRSAAGAQHRAEVIRAQELSDRGQLTRSNEALLRVVEAMSTASGRLERQYLPKAWGLLGMNYYYLGDLARARHFTELAMAACEGADDLDGVNAYRQNLHVIDKASAANKDGGS